MIATLVFVLVFVSLGLGAVLVGMRSGPRRKKDPGPSREGRSAAYAVTALATIVCLGVPAWILIDNGENHAKDAPGGVDLTEAQAEGRQHFKEQCATCHTLAASNAYAKVGPNLDQLRPPKELTLNAIEEGRARGQGQMPAGLLAGKEAEDVADYVAAVAGRAN